MDRSRTPLARLQRGPRAHLHEHGKGLADATACAQHRHLSCLARGRRKLPSLLLGQAHQLRRAVPDCHCAALWLGVKATGTGGGGVWRRVDKLSAARWQRSTQLGETGRCIKGRPGGQPAISWLMMQPHCQAAAPTIAVTAALQRRPHLRRCNGTRSREPAWATPPQPASTISQLPPRHQQPVPAPQTDCTCCSRCSTAPPLRSTSCCADAQ